MSVQKKTENKKKKSKDKGVKSKNPTKPGSKHAATKQETKLGKRKGSKLKKGRKHSKHDPNKPKKKKSKASKKPTTIGTVLPADVPKKVKKPPGEVAVEPKKELGGSGSLRVEKTQLSDDSLRRKQEKLEKDKKKEKKKEEVKVKKEEKKSKKDEKKEKKSKKEDKEEEKKEEKKPKEPKVKPVPPGTGSSPPTPEKKTKSSLDGATPDGGSKKKKEKKEKKEEKEEVKVVVTPEAKTPETVGPPMKKEESKKEKKKSGSRKVAKEKKDDEIKEGRKDGFDEMKLESERDNLEEKPAEPKKKDSSDPKKLKSESYKLKKTQSLSPINIAAPIVPGPPGKQTFVVKKTTKISEDDPDQMKTPPKDSERSGRVRIIEAQRSDLDQPPPEPDFVQNHGDTKINRMEIKKVDLDLVGRTGMYLERIGMNAERKQAFDWIAYNRHDMKNKQKEFSKNMAVALSDIGINKQLLMRTVIYLKSHGQISVNEMDKVLKEIQACKNEVVSFSQVSAFLKTHCETYQTTGSKESL